MSKAKELLLECKIKLGIQTDYKLAQALKINRGILSGYMKNKEEKGYRVPDAYACVRIALALRRDPAEIIAEIEAETEKNPERKAFWADFLLHVKKAGRFGMLALIFTTSLFAGLQTTAGGGFSRRAKFA